MSRDRRNYVEEIKLEAVQQARDLLVRPLADERKIGIKALSDLKAYETMSIEIQNSPYADVRIHIAIELGKQSDIRALPGLLEALDDNDSVMKVSALKSIEGLVLTKQILEYESIVLKLIRLFDDPNIEVRQNAEHVVVTMREPAIPYLISAIKDDSPQIKMSAVDALACLAKAGLAPLIEKAMPDLIGLVHEIRTVMNARNNTPENISSVAVEALIHIGRPTVAAFLKLLTDPIQDVRKYSVYALGEIGDPRSVKPLLETLRRENQFVNRDNVIPALERIGKPAVQLLIKALMDKNALIRVTAIRVLGDLLAAEAVQPIIKSLSDNDAIPALLDWPNPNRRVCEVAAEALVQIGTPEAIAAVEEYQRKK